MQRLPFTSFRRGLVVALLAYGTHAQAESPGPLVDPTRPHAVAVPAVAGAPARADSSAAPRAWPTLQSVQIPLHGDASAMVDGRIVRVGERIGDATLTAIDAQSIVLRTSRYTQHIGLTPGIGKTASATAPAMPNPPAVALTTKEHR